jgi:aminoglycoside 6-adenylyltransferase
MLALILGFAQADDRIRVAVMNGSRVDPNVEKDIFQDYDILYFVTDVGPFREEAGVVPHFGKPIIVQKVEDQIYRPGSGDGRHTYNIQFVDGNRIDMGFLPLGMLESHPSDSLTRVLLDKDRLLPDLPSPSERSYFITEPTQQWYDDCCNTFLFTLGSHIPKTLWRRKLPLLKCHTGRLREDLILMLSWHVGVTRGFNRSLGSEGKNLQQHLEPTVWQEFVRTYTGPDYADIWKSLLTFHSLFARVARSVGNHYGYQFPAQESEGVLAFFEHVMKLAPDAQSIYSEYDATDAEPGVAGDA